MNEFESSEWIRRWELEEEEVGADKKGKPGGWEGGIDDDKGE